MVLPLALRPLALRLPWLLERQRRVQWRVQRRVQRVQRDRGLP